MANIYNHNFQDFMMKINKDEYWDFFISRDWFSPFSINGNSFVEKCLVSYIDASKDECVDNGNLIGLPSYTWDSAVSNSNYVLLNVGYTAYDNGLFTFRKDRILNSDFLSIYQDTKYIVDSPTLLLHRVSGSTLQYDYPLTEMENEIKLNGGFYQGFFETECDKYAILPSKIEDEWNLEFVLKKSDLEKESNKTLNDKYPNNKGIFFYIGTRAENKWIYLYDDKEDECFTLDISDYIEDAEIDKNTYLINNFLDMSIDFVEDEEISNDNYIDFKYYENDAYEEIPITKDDFFLSDYLEDDEIEYKKILKEGSKPKEILRWCDCGGGNKKKGTKTSNGKTWYRYYGCGCGKFYKVKYAPTNSNDDTDTDDSQPLGKCTIFGDDYVSDLSSVDYETDFVENDIDISNFEYQTNDGFPLKSSNYYKILTDNKFLFFNRTKTGVTVDNWIEGTKFEFVGKKTAYKDNLFLLLNRTCTGYTVSDIEKLKEEAENKTDYNVYNDLYNNALAFRITDDGSIGYRYLTVDCEASDDNKTLIEEGYSSSGIIKDDEWYSIDVRIKTSYKYMKLYFYVNGKLKYITKDLLKLDLRKLADSYEKQETVPYSISLGGGTQGLIETILPNYMMNPWRVYPLEENFGGSFIGYIKLFRFYNCKIGFGGITQNYLYNKSHWG